MSPDSKMLTREEVAAILRVSPKTLANMASRGDGPPFERLGRRALYDELALHRWVDDQVQAQRARSGDVTTRGD